MADEPLLAVEDLVEMFEAAEDATVSAREQAERDKDYYDGIQYTAAEIKALNDRKQPITIANRIKRKVEFLRGYEMSQRVDPRAMPRTPRHEADADGVEQALRYVADSENFDRKRSRVFENLLIEGMGGYRVGVREVGEDIEVTIDRVPWDRMFYDPHSAEPDFSDANYLGGVVWKDFDDALAEYPDGREALEWTMDSSSISDTYDDKPKFRVWADKKRKRVRICYMWVRRQGAWHFAEFTKGGILKAGPSPYVDDRGESDCELIYGSAYVNRENERYGLVREMISIQDEINKRRSKSLHLLNTAQVTMEEGAVSDVERFRREAARPDGVMVISPGYTDKVKIETRLDLANGHQALLQEAKNEIDLMAGNIALQGNALNKSAASGKAIIASQQGGAMEIASLLDSLRDLDIRVFRAVWYRIRQYWTAEKWVRVTDDERNVKWLGLNVDPQQMQMAMQQQPELRERIAGTVANVAQLDMDIIIDDAPDGITPQLEQFQSLVELKKMDVNNELPFRALVLAMPNLHAKEQVLAAMDEAKQPKPQDAQIEQFVQQLSIEAGKAKLADVQAGVQLKLAQAQKAQAEASAPPDMGGPSEPPPDQLDMAQRMADVDDTRAATELKLAQAHKVMTDASLAPQTMAMQAEANRMRAQQRPAQRNSRSAAR